MKKISDSIQDADWKKEKHVPVIECSDEVDADRIFEIRVEVGKEIPHPNTTEHHISWVSLFFHPEGEKFPYQVGRCEFNAHGSSVHGPNTSTIYTKPAARIWIKTGKPGTILAVASCNVHGLWQSSKEIKLK